MRYYMVEEELFKRIYNDGQRLNLLKNYYKDNEYISNNPIFEQEFNPADLRTDDGKVYLVDDDPDERFLVTKSCQKQHAIHDVLTLLDEHSVSNNDIRAFLRGYLAGSYDGENKC